MVCITSGRWQDGAGNIEGISANVNWSDPNGKQLHELVKTFDGGQTWTDITPNPATSPGFPTGVRGRMSSVAISSANPDHIWITYSGFESLGYTCNGSRCNINVFFTNDGGLTWYPFNDGLPKVPARKIVYRNFSEDELYLGTEAGVFYRNAYMSQWECFSDGLPNCEVTDIEIDYCEQKLVAATFGDGMWSTPLAPIEESYIYNDYTIPAGVTTFAANTIRVINNATFTIQGTLGMPQGTKIIVEPGSTLVLDGGTITNTCAQMWDGVEVVGYANNAHPAISMANFATTAHAAHGLMVLKKNGANVPKIEHATAGVTATNGGIVLAEDALLQNNQKALVFNAFRPSVSGGGCSGFTNCDNNVSYAKRCTLEVTDAARFTGASTDRFVSITGTYGIEISESIFRNTNTQPGLFPDNARGTGVYVLDGSANLLGTPTAYNQFNTLTRGVDLNFTSLATFATEYKATVNYNRFTDIREVALLATGGTSRASFTLNTLTLPSNSTFLNPYGIYLNGSLTPVVEENTITGGMPGITGLYVKNGGGSTSWKIYRNTFSNIPADAVVLDGTNTYIQVSCNTFTNIFGYNVKAFKTGTGAAISSQGTSGQAAGNSINDSNGSCTTANGLDHFWLNTGNTAISYFHSGTLVTSNSQNPTCKPSSVTTTPNITVNSCPSSWGGGGGANKTAQSLKGDAEYAWNQATIGPEQDREWWMGEYLRITQERLAGALSQSNDAAIAILHEHPTDFALWQEPALLIQAGKTEEARKQLEARLANTENTETVAARTYLQWQLAHPSASVSTELNTLASTEYGSGACATALVAALEQTFVELEYRTMADGNGPEQLPMSLQAQPNPTAGETLLHWNLNGDRAATLTVFDPTGKVILTQTLEEASNATRINLSDYAQGIYLVQLKTAAGYTLSTRISHLN